MSRVVPRLTDHGRLELAAARMVAQFGLSPAEAELLLELIAGRSLAQAAKHLGRARNTVRNQLQSIFAKTATHRQAQLIVRALNQIA